MHPVYRLKEFRVMDLLRKTHSAKPDMLSTVMSTDLHLSITPLKITEIPSEDSIIASGQALLDSATSWKHGKTYQKNTVRTLSRAKGPRDGAAWHCRVSEHPPGDATFDEFWSKLGVDKAENEMQFIPDIKKATFPRVFTVVQTVHLSETSPKTGIIVSVPVDLTAPGSEDLAKLEEKGVKGRYVSVERLTELDNGNVEWRMATSSTPGGKIPQFVAESSMASTISHDVTHFLHWFHSIRANPTPATTDESAPAATADVHASTAANEAVSNAAGA
ncbi:hypothetical protein A0H81_10772 [Grifola frondosa]|uniref:DUF3074 domain-containing protein n=1 Tax=Grifola frondosa TaxID=5627 RepID=A0A1C7LY82_GRIFR|nr:hypothetical protein A0H81_10772 [Grifola frondosa]